MGIDTTLAGLLAHHQRTPFAWGQFDCCQWVRIALREIAGKEVDIPAYRSERGAMRVLAGIGGYDGAMARYNAHALPSVSLAQRGDVVLVEAEGHFGGALAICAGSTAYAVGPDGLHAAPMSIWLRAWRVACLK